MGNSKEDTKDSASGDVEGNAFILLSISFAYSLVAQQTQIIHQWSDLLTERLLLLLTG